MKTTIIDGKRIQVNKDLSMTIDNKTFKRSEIEEYKNTFKGMNRIHKPLHLLFWIDVRGHNTSGYKLV